LDFANIGSVQAMAVTRSEEGVKRIALRLHVLFDEGTPFFQLGSLAILDRVQRMIENRGHEPVQLVFQDEIGPTPAAQDLHTERVNAVLSYLAFNLASDRMQT
jgi:hypothetical protein